MRSALPTARLHLPLPPHGSNRRRRTGALVTALLAGAVASAGMTPAVAATSASTSTTVTTAPVSDRFGRTVTSGWATAERGGTWTTTAGTVRHSVTDGAGHQRIARAGQTGWAHLNGYTSTDTDLTLDVALDKMPTGGGTYVSVVGRRVGTSGDYRARLKLQSSGAVSLTAGRGETALDAATLPGVEYSAGTRLSIRLQVTGTYPTTIRAKAWVAGTAEPSGWQVSTTDSTSALQRSGGIATSTYVSGSARNLPATTSYTRLAAQPVVSNVAPTPAVAVEVADLTAVLDGSASVDHDGSIASHTWSFGDGATAAGPTATHTYSAAGTYTVTLAVTDDAGARTSKTSLVTVTKPNEAPVARVDATTQDLTASLDGSASTDADGQVTTYAWTFGDGTTGSGPTARHSYSTAGTYTVGLTVTDDKGARSTTSSALTVVAPAPAPAPAPGTVKPGPTNTGVPTGTRLTIHHGDLVITTPGAVIDALDIRGLVIIKAPDVTIKRSIIRGRPITGSNALIMNGYGAYRFTLQDSELVAAHPSPYINGIIGANFTVQRTNIHGVIDQVHITGDNVTVESSWLHDNLHYTNDPQHPNGSHDDNVQVQGGRNITLTGNTMTDATNAALQVTQDRAAVTNLTYTKNWADNGGCTLNIAQKNRGPLQGMVITDNTFGKTTTFNCAILYPATSPITFANNLYTDHTPIKMIKR